MEFEFDDRKSEDNLGKHGIGFLDAQLLWADPDRLEIPAKTADEPRTIVIGIIEGKVWAAVITYRGKKARIISVRRARKDEVKIYEGQGI